MIYKTIYSLILARNTIIKVLRTLVGLEPTEVTAYD